MADNKTRPTNKSVVEFLNNLDDERKRQDSFTLLKMMEQITAEPPVMWGESIVGFGTYHYKYASGRQGDMPLAGFSPRKQDLTIYITAGFEQYAALLEKLGKHKLGKACLYIKRLEGIDLDVLREIVRMSYDHMRGLKS